MGIRMGFCVWNVLLVLLDYSPAPALPVYHSSWSITVKTHNNLIIARKSASQRGHKLANALDMSSSVTDPQYVTKRSFRIQVLLLAGFGHGLVTLYARGWSYRFTPYDKTLVESRINTSPTPP